MAEKLLRNYSLLFRFIAPTAFDSLPDRLPLHSLLISRRKVADKKIATRSTAGPTISHDNDLREFPTRATRNCVPRSRR